MRVSVTLHREMPDEDGNQRDKEARYQGFNRQYADMLVHDQSGAGICEFRGLTFPTVTADPEFLPFFSVGVCIAPPCRGGAIIIAGPLDPPLTATVGRAPSIGYAAMAITPDKMKKLGLIKYEDGRWVEKSEAELTNVRSN